MKKLFILILLISQYTFADSPLTSTDFYKAYIDVPLVQEGKSTSNNGTNSSGFGGLPGGWVHIDGIFHSIGKKGSWWYSNEAHANMVQQIGLLSRSRLISYSFTDKATGNSVRCLKE